MTSIIHFERPGFDDIVAAIRRIFPVGGASGFGLTPDSIDKYFRAGGVELSWQRIPDWESYEWGHREISDEEFINLLFSPRRPASDEIVIAVTDECFYERQHQGFSFRFADFLPFVRIYPQLTSPSVGFFQPSDTIFLAEQSKLLVMLHHGGVRTQYAAQTALK